MKARYIPAVVQLSGPKGSLWEWETKFLFPPRIGEEMNVWDGIDDLPEGYNDGWALIEKITHWTAEAFNEKPSVIVSAKLLSNKITKKVQRGGE